MTCSVLLGLQSAFVCMIHQHCLSQFTEPRSSLRKRLKPYPRVSNVLSIVCILNQSYHSQFNASYEFRQGKT
jgi:hypothetical protein